MALCPGWWLDLVPLSLRAREKHCMAQSEAAQNSKDITMPVIKWLRGKGSSHKTARRMRTIGGENTDDTNASLRNSGLVRLGILSSPLLFSLVLGRRQSVIRLRN